MSGVRGAVGPGFPGKPAAGGGEECGFCHFPDDASKDFCTSKVWGYHALFSGPGSDAKQVKKFAKGEYEKRVKDEKVVGGTGGLFQGEVDKKYEYRYVPTTDTCKGELYVVDQYRGHFGTRQEMLTNYLVSCDFYHYKNEKSLQAFRAELVKLGAEEDAKQKSAEAKILKPYSQATA